MSVTVVMPHVPLRIQYLARAVASVAAQTVPADEIHIAVDNEHKGAGATRNRALFSATSEYLLFLDDDDELEPTAIEKLTQRAEETGADIVYPWFYVSGELGRNPVTGQMRYAGDPFPEMFGRPFEPTELEHRNFIPVTILVRADVARAVGGYPTAGAEDWPHDTCEDWGFLRRLVKAGAKFEHLSERLWRWNIHHTEMPHYTGKPWK